MDVSFLSASASPPTLAPDIVVCLSIGTALLTLQKPALVRPMPRVRRGPFGSVEYALDYDSRPPYADQNDTLKATAPRSPLRQGGLALDVLCIDDTPPIVLVS